MSEDAACPGCGHSVKRHNELGYCQVFYRSVREYCGCGIVSGSTSPDPRPVVFGSTPGGSDG